MEYFLHTIALPMATLITVVANAIGVWLWTKRHERALTENTNLTKKAMQNSASAADKAAAAAEVAQVAAAETSKSLNGRLDEMIKAAYEKGLAEGQLKKQSP